MTSHQKDRSKELFFIREKIKKRDACLASRFKRIQIKYGTSSANEGQLPKKMELKDWQNPLHDDAGAVFHDSPLFSLFFHSYRPVITVCQDLWPDCLSHW